MSNIRFLQTSLYIRILIIGLLNFSLVKISQADNLKGKKQSATCAACHGENGKSNAPIWPNLAGQKHEYLVKQLKDFKGGERKDPVMSSMAATLSDQDIEDLAQYYSQMK